MDKGHLGHLVHRMEILVCVSPSRMLVGILGSPSLPISCVMIIQGRQPVLSELEHPANTVLSQVHVALLDALVAKGVRISANEI